MGRTTESKKEITFAFSSALPPTLLCSCAMQSALPSSLFTLLCPASCLAPRNALPSSLLVVRHFLLSALCAVRYATFSCSALCPTLSFALP